MASREHQNVPSVWDTVLAVDALKAQGRRNKDIAESLGVTSRTVQRYSSLKGAPDDYRLALKADSLSVTQALAGIKAGIPASDAMGLSARAIVALAEDPWRPEFSDGVLCQVESGTSMNLFRFAEDLPASLSFQPRRAAIDLQERELFHHSFAELSFKESRQGVTGSALQAVLDAGGNCVAEGKALLAGVRRDDFYYMVYRFDTSDVSFSRTGLFILKMRPTSPPLGFWLARASGGDELFFGNLAFDTRGQTSCLNGSGCDLLAFEAGNGHTKTKLYASASTVAAAPFGLEDTQYCYGAGRLWQEGESTMGQMRQDAFPPGMEEALRVSGTFEVNGKTNSDWFYGTYTYVPDVPFMEWHGAMMMKHSWETNGQTLAWLSRHHQEGYMVGLGTLMAARPEDE